MITRLSVFAFVAATLAAPSAHAFCGFFVAGSSSKLTNPASQVAIVRQGSRTTMSLSNTYQGPPENFAMIVPVPVVLHEKDVRTLDLTVFDHIDALSAPRLVEYWEQDPCSPPVKYEKRARSSSRREMAMDKDDSAVDRKLGVTIEAKFAVGEYQILILSAKESNGLDQWLRLNHYTIPDGAAEALAPYVADKMKFFVAKVDIKKVKKNEQGLIQLSPLRVTYESQEVRLPVRLGLLNAGPKQDLVVYMLSPDHRYEVANYPNLFIPTNLDVADEVRHDFPSFYAELFDAALAPRQNKAVVTEYAWQTTSCDPCPTPPLASEEIEILGADLGRGVINDIGPSNQRRPSRGGFNAGAGWVLTRLHARYDKTSLSDDLIFKEAPPVWGGRANWDGQSADAGAKLMSGGANNFQGRYIIRHYWQGQVKCQTPQYGQWGGPPNGASAEDMAAAGGAKAGKGLALAARGKIALRKVVRSPVPTLGIPGAPPPRHAPAQQ
jgi:hypothetical protein